MGLVEVSQLPSKVRQRLHPDEEVVQCIGGYSGQDGEAAVKAFLLLTHKRVLLVSTRWLSTTEVAIPVASIRSVRTVTGLGSGITIEGGGDSIKFLANRRYLTPFEQRLEQLRAGGETETRAEVKDGAGDVLAQIKQLGDLHAAGVLTEDEFAAKKAELLARL